METLRLLLLLAVVGSLWAAWRRHLYPGGWAYALSGQYADERQRLKEARDTVHELKRAAQTEHSEAKNAVDATENQRRQRIHTLERHLAEIRSPSDPLLRPRLGELALHRHTLRVGTKLMPLAGLQADFDPSSQCHYIYLTGSDRRQTPYKYPHAQYEEDEVRNFVVAIRNAAVDEAEFLEKREAEEARLKEELELARGDTSDQDAARERLSQVTLEQQQDPRPEQARRELEAARDRWQALTGRRPPG